MITLIHMQDQVNNRIEDFMDENKHYDWDEIFQNASTFSLLILFMTLGLSW